MSAVRHFEAAHDRIDVEDGRRHVGQVGERHELRRPTPRDVPAPPGTRARRRRRDPPRNHPLGTPRRGRAIAASSPFSRASPASAASTTATSRDRARHPHADRIERHRDRHHPGHRISPQRRTESHGPGQRLPGMRTDPPVSVYRARTGRDPAASAAPLPPLLPPAIRSGACGLRIGPYAALFPVM